MKIAAAWALGFAAILVGMTSLSTGAARAEVDEVRIGTNISITSLPLYVMKQDGLLEKHAKELGIEPPKVSLTLVSGGNVLNDGLLSGTIDFATTGIPALLPLWAKTRDNLDVRAVAAIAAFPLTLVSREPRIQSVKDFTDQDRIALLAVKVSAQAILLQMAAEKAFGPGEFNRLDHLTVARSHPDATAALLSGAGEINSYFSAPPFVQRVLKDPNIHKVTDSREIFDGDLTSGIVYGTGKFREQNPKTYQAFYAALGEAIEVINRDKAHAAKIYLETTNDKMSQEEVAAILSDPSSAYGLTPINTLALAQFMKRTGAIAIGPEKWQDMFFPEAWVLPGS